MSDKYLHRDQAPFGQAVWERLDATVVATARARLAGRRLLHVDGPYGLALTSLGGDSAVAQAVSDRVTLRVPALTPLPAIASPFTLPVRDVAAFETNGAPLNLEPAARAAAACAEQEDDVVFNGIKSAGLPGLLTAKGSRTCKLGVWKETGSAVANILQGVNSLDEAGFRGPYALALAPALYNTLFRCYPQGGPTELEHLRQVVTEGIVKTAAVGAGGVLVAANREYAAIVLGQDLTTGFVGPAEADYAFTVSASVVLRLADPACVCVLR
ncbi:MAG: family 1 encapsulin nanocompartment shell protein [Kiritimatiellae bacterium]|nr:family 1 encapsulin nanocompartment shell protein [Kiritimatiellia bacterium]